MFTIYADYGYIQETALSEHPTLEDAKRAFENLDCEDEGVGILEIASFAEDGEYIPHARKTHPHYEAGRGLVIDA
jgi:hypothetical protein